MMNAISQRPPVFLHRLRPTALQPFAERGLTLSAEVEPLHLEGRQLFTRPLPLNDIQEILQGVLIL
jgi:hypothetical protein